MTLNRFKIEGDYITLKTKAPLVRAITKEFTEWTGEKEGEVYVYKFEMLPNMCFAIRALLAKYKDIFSADRDVLVVLNDKTKLATMPILSLYHTEKHVEIQCPPLDYYLELISAVGAANKGMNTYTVPIARAFDVIRASTLR